MSATAVQAGTFLHHIQLESPQPDRLAGFYADALDMTAEPLGGDRWLCVGPDRQMLFARGDAQKLAFGAFACRDAEALRDLRRHAEREGVAIEKSPSPLFDDSAFAVRDPDGNTIIFGLARENAVRGMHAPLQHLTIGTFDVGAIESFYADKLGFLVSDRVFNDKGELTTCFLRSNHEHHTLGCFRSAKKGIDHHSYEAGEWTKIRDWCDRFGERNIPLMWGPGRHGPGNNLFVFIEDPDRNWIEVSAEIEVIRDRPVKHWPHGERTLNLWGRAILRS